MENPKRYTVTAALPYANGSKHIGHLAGAYLPADIYVRYLRMQNRDVVFVCGSDENGAAITLKAIQEETTPQAIVDRYHHEIERAFQQMGISFDVYDRTSSPLHHETAKEFFLELNKKDVFTKETNEQFYDEKAGVFLADRYIRGTCPKCQSDRAFGDQCENCGSDLSPLELIDPKSVITDVSPVLRETTHYYLPLDKYEDWLKSWLLEGHTEWKSNVYGQCKSWLDGGLKKRAITRDLDWGVKVPVKGQEDKVLYVWFDAPIGYISATKRWALEHDRDWEPYWKSEDTQLVHFIGKDNIVFHCISFPVMLHAHGDYILPDAVPANEFMNLEGDKMSTSRGWSVEMTEYLEAFPKNVDSLRYFLTLRMPETKDSEFTWRDFQAAHNNELANDIGNFAQRVLVLLHKYNEGKVPDSSACSSLQGVLDKAQSDMANAYEHYRFRDALQAMMSVARYGNKFLGDAEPWKTIKTDREAALVALYDAVQILANLAYWMEPILPFKSKELLTMLNLDAGRSWADLAKADLMEVGHEVKKPTILFEKIEDEAIEKQVAHLKAKAERVETEEVTPKYMEPKKEIDFSDFTKIDIRVGTIVEAEKIKKADRLLKLTVDLGFEKRTVVSGIAEHFSPAECLGQKVAVVINLAPRKMRGVESQGMILMADKADGGLAFVAPDASAENGMTVA